MTLKGTVTLAALLVATGSTASHAGGLVLFGHHNRYHATYANTYAMGRTRGYQDGFDHGGQDGRDGDDYAFAHDKAYRCGDAGYRDWYGSKHEYVSGYRYGYEAGYRHAYSRSAARCTRRNDRVYESGHYGREYGRDYDRDAYRYDDDQR